jgi:hypothetical protein
MLSETEEMRSQIDLLVLPNTSEMISPTCSGGRTPFSNFSSSPTVPRMFGPDEKCWANSSMMDSSSFADMGRRSAAARVTILISSGSNSRRTPLDKSRPIAKRRAATFSVARNGLAAAPCLMGALNDMRVRS